jgi:hypothetical protein
MSKQAGVQHAAERPLRQSFWRKQKSIRGILESWIDDVGGEDRHGRHYSSHKTGKDYQNGQDEKVMHMKSPVVLGYTL